MPKRKKSLNIYIKIGRRSGTSGRYDFNLNCLPKGWGY
nr:MAG TPA: hypothetical protein [Caudoviricetes sp.]